MRLTLGEINLLTKVEVERRDVAFEERMYDLHLAGSLNTFAFNDPKKYPKLKALLPKKSSIIPPEENEDFRRQGAAVGLRVP